MLLFLLFTSMASPMFAIIAGRRLYRRSFLWYYCVIAMIFDILAYILKNIVHVNYYWPGNVFVTIEFLSFIFFFRSTEFSLSRKFLPLSLIVLVIYFSTFVKRSFFELNSFGISLLYFYYIILSLLGFHRALIKPKAFFIEKTSFFWANTAIFIYTSGAFFILLFQEVLKKQNVQVLAEIWGTLFLSLNILKNILLGIALSKKEER